MEEILKYNAGNHKTPITKHRGKRYNIGLHNNILDKTSKT